MMNGERQRAQSSRYNQYQQQQGATPLREQTYARQANQQSFGTYEAPVETGDVILAEHERVISTERLTASVVEQPILVPDFRIVERPVERVKTVIRHTTHEQPVVQNVMQPVQIVVEVPVERIVEKPYIRKVIIERIIEQVVEVVKDVPVERIQEQIIEIVKEVPIEKVIERIQIKEIPVVETEERVVEVVREIPVEIVKEIPVYIKVDPTEWDSRHNLQAATVTQSYPSGNFTQSQAMVSVGATGYSNNASNVDRGFSTVNVDRGFSTAAEGVGGVGLRLARYQDSGNTTYVCEIVPNSPAFESRQVSINDIVTHVDNQDVLPMSLNNVNAAIRGPVGSNVVITMTAAAGGTKTVTLSRRAYGT